VGKVDYFAVPSEARNLSLMETREKRDSSARCVPRNDKMLIFSAAFSAREYSRAEQDQPLQAEVSATSC
jgi:hypothetical protein